MKTKLKLKIAIDLAMSIIFILLMNTAWTGVFIHEWLGVIILALFAGHLLINRQWIRNMISHFRKITSKKAKGQLILNAMLTLSMGATMVSGILISEYLFSPLASDNVNLWYTCHAVASWLTLGVVMAHTGLHWRWIKGLVQRIMPSSKIKIFAARATIGILALVAAYSLINNSVIDLLMPDSSSARVVGEAIPVSADTSGTENTTLVQGQTDAKNNLVILPAATTVVTDPVITLQEYLSKLYCTACNKNCLLTNPRCSRGTRQVEKATSEYYASYDN